MIEEIWLNKRTFEIYLLKKKCFTEYTDFETKETMTLKLFDSNQKLLLDSLSMSNFYNTNTNYFYNGLPKDFILIGEV